LSLPPQNLTAWERFKAATLCRWLGHKYSIRGVTGRFQWCSRCRTRHEISEEQAEAAADFQFMDGQQWRPDQIVKVTVSGVPRAPMPLGRLPDGSLHIATLKAGTKIIDKTVDGIIIAHPDDPVTLVRWDGTFEELKQ
jgi:hypothetical protein